MARIGTIMFRVAVLCAAIFVVLIIHELGHYLTFTAYGIHVDEVRIGIGPSVLSFTSDGTIFSFRPIPLMGVNMVTNAAAEQAFHALPFLSREIVHFAGIGVGLVSASFGFLWCRMRCEELRGTLREYLCFVADLPRKFALTFVGASIALFRSLIPGCMPRPIFSGLLRVPRCAPVKIRGLILLTVVVNLMNLLPLSGLDGGHIFTDVLGLAGVPDVAREVIFIATTALLVVLILCGSLLRQKFEILAIDECGCGD